MNDIILIVGISIYGFCVHLNYLWFKDLMKNEMGRGFAERFWIYLLSGPILTGKVIYKKIKRYRRERALVKSIMKNLPQLIEEYDLNNEEV